MTHFKVTVAIVNDPVHTDVKNNGGIYRSEIDVFLYATDFAAAETMVKDYAVKDFEILSIEALED